MMTNKKEEKLEVLDTSDITQQKSDHEENEQVIDFKQNILNERVEVAMTIQPTYGVTYDKSKVVNANCNNVTNLLK